MLSKCLSRCQSTPFISSAVVGAIGCIRQNLKNTFSQMTCDLENHLNMNIVAICLQIECNKNRRVLCIKCMISSDHIEHALSFLIIQDALNSQKELNRLLRFLTDFSTGTIDDPEGQIEWLYDVLILGGSAEYPQFDDLLSNFQKEINDNLLEIRSQFEQELEKSHRTVVSSIQGKSPSQKEKLWKFKRDVNQIIKQNNQKIKNKFNKIFLQETISEQRSFDNFQFSQDSKLNLNNSHKQLNFFSLQQEFPLTTNQQQQTSSTPNKLQTLSSSRQQQELTSLKSYQKTQSIGQQINEDIEDESTIHEEQEQQIHLPCFSFIQEAPPQKFPYFNKRKSVTFNEGGKLINLLSGTRIISNIAFDQGNIEIRIKILSEILGCVHIGIIEQTIFQHLTQADETAGIWCCLHPCNCTVQSNMQSSVHFLTLSPQSIIGINLNFTNDQISIKQYTHQNIITLYNKHGSLMKQKQLLFIKSDQPVQIELIN